MVQRRDSGPKPSRWRPLASLLAVLAAGVAGYALGSLRTDPPPAPDLTPPATSSLAEPVVEVRAPAEPSHRPPDQQGLRDDLRDCRTALEGWKELALLEQEPLVQWGPEIPERFGPEVFEEVVERMKRECPDIEIGGFDCSEPPCAVAMILGPDELPHSPVQHMLDCDPWNERYPDGYTITEASAPCPGGEQRALIVAPVPSRHFEAFDRPPENPLVVQRLEKRGLSLVGDFPCWEE